MGRPGDTIKELRKQLRWTQGDLAKRLGTSQSTISAWECGRRPLPPPLAAIIDELVTRSQLGRFEEVEEALGAIPRDPQGQLFADQLALMAEVSEQRGKIQLGVADIERLLAGPLRKANREVRDGLRSVIDRFTRGKSQARGPP